MLMQSSASPFVISNAMRHVAEHWYPPFGWARSPIICGSRAWSSVLAPYADLPFMYLFEPAADDLCGPVRSLWARSAVARALPCWDPRGGLAWRRGLPVRAAPAREAMGRAAMRLGPSGLTSSGVLLVSRSGSCARAVPHAPTSVRGAEPGVMMALESISRNAGIAAAAPADAAPWRCGSRRSLGFSISGTTPLAPLPGSAASRSGHGRAARGGCGRFAA
jgi:hypothetical protein